MKIHEFRGLVGQEVGVSDWLPVDQFRINVFAECTEDRQWIHTDVKRSREESPFGAPVAHGYLTLSLLTYFQDQCGLLPKDGAVIVNYGLDSVRFISPVVSGSNIRDRITLSGIDQKKDKVWRVVFKNEVEVQGKAGPAMIADNVLMLFEK